MRATTLVAILCIVFGASFSGFAVGPTVTINQKIDQDDPTNATPINFTVVFSAPVSGFATGDVVLSGTAEANTGVITGSGSTYNVAVSDMAEDGTVIAYIPAGVCIDGSSNANLASTYTDRTVTYDTTGPTVTINQASDQQDPTNDEAIDFTVVFSESVTGFASGDETLEGTAEANTGVITGSGSTYNLAAGGMSSYGTVIASIDSGVCTDAAGNDNDASTSNDHSVTSAPDLSVIGGDDLLLDLLRIELSDPSSTVAGDPVLAGYLRAAVLRLAESIDASLLYTLKNVTSGRLIVPDASLTFSPGQSRDVETLTPQLTRSIAEGKLVIVPR